MTPVAAALLAGAAASLPAERAFWVIEEGSVPQPVQVEVQAKLVARGASIAVYQDRDDAPLAPAELDEVVSVFDSKVFPQQVGMFGPCPDRDGNGVVLLLVSAAAGEGTFFSRFDALQDSEAAAYGMRSNGGEVIYTALRHRGNRLVWNSHEVASAFHQILHYARDPRELTWRHLFGNFAGILAGVTPQRALWGEADADGRSFLPDAPWASDGWPLLFLHYLREQLGEGGLKELVSRPEQGFAALDALLAARGDARTGMDLLADFAMACWLDDTVLEGGRFGFRSVSPPRPHSVTYLKSSRPLSGQLSVGVGGMAFIVVEGTGERALPLALGGEAGLRWVARVVLEPRLGPDRVLPLAFEHDGTARLEPPPLEVGDRLVLAVVPGPADPAQPDDRTVVLQVGLGWVPRPPPPAAVDDLATLVAEELPAGGQPARLRLSATVARLTGAAHEPTDQVTTRYAWAPERTAVTAAIVDELTARGLPAKVHNFQKSAQAGVTQTWSNVLVELPGSDQRRWPVVLAAHWDAACRVTEESYLGARGLHDNASGVAVAIEAASALQRRERRAPIIIALLAGGQHGAAGAQALLETTGGRIATWIELDGVGIPAPAPRQRTVMVGASERPLQLAATLHAALRSVGLVARHPTVPFPPHTGAPFAASRGIPFAVLRAPEGPADSHAVPVAVERALASDDYMLLLAKAVADALAYLAGGS